MPELIFILVIALLIFGPKKLPDLGKQLGRGLGEFKRASNDLKRTIEDEMEKATEPSPDPKASVPPEPPPAATARAVPAPAAMNPGGTVPVEPTGGPNRPA